MLQGVCQNRAGIRLGRDGDPRAVIPANAGIHLDPALYPFSLPGEEHMGPSFRWDDDQAAICAAATWFSRNSTCSASSCGLYLATKALAPTRSTMALLNTPDSEVWSST